MLALVLVLGASALPSPQPASAAPGTWYPIKIDGIQRGRASCTYTYKLHDVMVSSIVCTVQDNRADRYWVFVVPSYYDGSAWKTVSGYGNRSCTNKSGAGSSLTCTHAFTWPNTDSMPVRIRVGLINKNTGAVAKTQVWSDDWLSPV